MLKVLLNSLPPELFIRVWIGSHLLFCQMRGLGLAAKARVHGVSACCGVLAHSFGANNATVEKKRRESKASRVETEFEI